MPPYCGIGLRAFSVWRWSHISDTHSHAGLTDEPSGWHIVFLSNIHQSPIRYCEGRGICNTNPESLERTPGT